MVLIDTNGIREARKGRANRGPVRFFEEIAE